MPLSYPLCARLGWTRWFDCPFNRTFWLSHFRLCYTILELPKLWPRVPSWASCNGSLSNTNNDGLLYLDALLKGFITVFFLPLVHFLQNFFSFVLASLWLGHDALSSYHGAMVNILGFSTGIGSFGIAEKTLVSSTVPLFHLSEYAGKLVTTGVIWRIYAFLCYWNFSLSTSNLISPG